MNRADTGKCLYGAIEAGGTKFVCEVADHQGRVLAASRIPTTRPQETLTAALDFFAAQEAPGLSYAGFGIAAFGPLDLQQDSPTFGHILATPKPDWSHTDLLSPFRQRFACPVAIDTDVNAAALAEAVQGSGQGCDPVVYITVGTGIGGGVFINGSTLQGSSKSPLHPEMGHIRVRRHPRDADFAGTCPFHGDCLEGLASGAAIAARYGRSLDVLPAGHEGVEVIGDYLGQLATNVILLLSPAKVIFGGGVMQHEPVQKAMRRTTASLLNGYAGLGKSAAALETLLVAPGLGQRSGISGALLLAMKLK